MFGRYSSNEWRLAPSRYLSRRTLAALTVGLLALGAMPADGLAQAKLPGAFRGEAYGSFANAKAGSVATTLGRSAYLPCPCKGTNGKTLTNKVTSVSADEVVEAATVLSTLKTAKGSTTATMTTTSEIIGLDLFDGLVTADVIKAISRTDAKTGALSAGGGASIFTNLKVAGRTVAADTAANTKLQLAGIGTVTLKRTVTQKNGNTSIKLTVDMLVVDVKVANRFELDVGAQIVIGHAVSGYTRNEPPASVSGQAYLTLASTEIGVDLENQIGKAAFVSIGCEGTDGKTRTNNIDSLAVGRLLSLGTGETTAFGGPSATGADARTTATVESVRLLNGLISATTIKAAARETVVNGVRTRSTAGSTFGGLRITGISLPLTIPANFRVPLVGLGYVILNEQIKPAPGGGRTQANGLRLVVTTPNLIFRLPVGTQITIAHADALAQKS